MSPGPVHPTKDAGEIRAWLIDALARLLDVSASELDPACSFFDYGLDSSAAIGVTDLLGQWLGREVDPALLYDYPTIDELSAYVAQDLRRSA